MKWVESPCWSWATITLGIKETGGSIWQHLLYKPHNTAKGFTSNLHPNKSHYDRKSATIHSYLVCSDEDRGWGFPHVSRAIKNRCHKLRVTNRGGGREALTKAHLSVAARWSDLSTDSHIYSPNHKTAPTLIANIYSDQTTPPNASEDHICEI